MSNIISKIKSLIKEYWQYCLIAVVVVIAALGVFGYKQYQKSQQETVVYADFYKLAKNGKVDSIDYTSGSDTFTYKLKDSDKVYKTDNPKVEDFKEKMLLFGIEEFNESVRFHFLRFLVWQLIY